MSVTFEPLSSTYCKADTEIVRQDVEARISFDNLTVDRTLSVRRDGVHVERVLAANDAADFARGKYEAQMSVTTAIAGEADVEELTPQAFLTLRPGESRSTETTFQLFVAASSKTQLAGVLQPRSYFVAIEISPWFWSESAAARAEARLRDIGKVLTEAVRAAPIKMAIMPPRSLPDCR